MNLRNSLILSLGLGLFSPSKLAEGITHRRTYTQNPTFLSNRVRLTGFIPCYSPKSISHTVLRSSSDDSSDIPELEEHKPEQIETGSSTPTPPTDFGQNKFLSGINDNADETSSLNEDLSRLISVHSEIIKKEDPVEDLSRYDWFNDDPEASDEELITEYYESKMPNMDEVYKNLDPVGIRNYVPDYPRSDSFFGRVYEVGESLIEERKWSNSHTYEELVEKARRNSPEYKASKINMDETKTFEEFMEKMQRLDLEQDEDLKDNSKGRVETEKSQGRRPMAEEDDDDFHKYEGVNEFDFGEQFPEDSEDVVLEDEMCRFLLEVPLRSWVNDEVAVFDSSMEKLVRGRKYYTEADKGRFVTDFRAVFDESPMGTAGVFDNTNDNLDFDLPDQNDSDPENGKRAKTFGEVVRDKISKNSKDLVIKEYKHSDLLNDIDKYVSSEYPEVVDAISRRDQNRPIFVLNPGEGENGTGSTSSKARVTVKSPQVGDYDINSSLSVYVGVPKNFINFERLDSVVINDSVAFRRSYDVTVGKQIERIPLQDEYHIATIVLPNEAGFRDQNIRYLADEIAVNTKGLVFVPEVPVISPHNKHDQEWYSILLNRLLKLIQAVYKVDRISFLALGEQGNALLDYITNSMNGLISYYESQLKSQNKIDERDEKRRKDDWDEFLEKFSTERVQELIRRQSIPMMEELLEGIKNIKLSQSHQEARKSKDPNTIKPLSSVLQSVVLYDTSDIDLEKVVNLSVPTLVLSHSRTDLIGDILSSESPGFLKVKDKKLYDPKFEGVNMFPFAYRELPDKLKLMIQRALKFRHVASTHNIKMNADQYYISTFHTGIDIMLYLFKKASPHFYMKKPGASKDEFRAIKDSLVRCADWIRSWSY